MKRIIRIFALVIALSMVLTATCFAKVGTSPTDRTKLNVRVNGYEVEFPDAQPYIDENGRTMIPLRFATEALGAEVEWEQATRTASITKNGITVKVSIGQDLITIIENGGERQVQMNTTAVLKEGRTYVPIRYVAEALGAYVDYSNIYKTVGIYQDVLTADEIEKLHSYQRYDYMIGSSYNEALINKSSLSAADASKYSYLKEFTESFASAREIMYDENIESSRIRYFNDLGITGAPCNEDLYFETLVKEAVAELNWQSEGLNIEFRTDTSCIYATPDASSRTFSVRGYLVITYANNNWTEKGVSHRSSMDYVNNFCVEKGLGYKIPWPHMGESVIVPIDAQLEVKTQAVEVVGIIVLEAPEPNESKITVNGAKHGTLGIDSAKTEGINRFNWPSTFMVKSGDAPKSEKFLTTDYPKLECLPDPGYWLSDIKINGKSVGAQFDYPFEITGEDMTVTAVFEKIEDPVTLTLTVYENAAIYVYVNGGKVDYHADETTSKDIFLPRGTEITVKLYTGIVGCDINEVVIDGENREVQEEYTLVVDDDMSIVAHSE